MAVREVRLQRHARLGLVSSGLSVLGALVGLGLMWQNWDSQTGMIGFGGKLRFPVIVLTLLTSMALGFAGFMLSLEGAAELQGKWRKYSWLGFGLGVAGAIMAIVFGLIVHFLRLKIA
jgi:hypothetical protein